MSYVQYTRPKAPLSQCGALNARVKPMDETWSPADFAASGMKLSSQQLGSRGMGQDSTSTDAVTGLSIPNPLSAFSNLFSSTDFSTWGVGEWVVIAAVGFLGLKLVQGVFSTGKSVKRAVRKRRRRSQQRQSLLSQLESI